MLIILLIAFLAYIYKSLVTTVIETKIIKKENDEIRKSVNNSVSVYKLLNALMIKYSADRAYVFQFHNGVVFYDGKHKNHQSLSYEVCNKGISSEAMNLQNIPTSLYPLFLQEIMLNKMQYADINDIKEESTKLTLKEQGIKSIFVAPYFKDGKFIAYIGIDFVKEKFKKDFIHKDFKSFTNEIGNILIQ